MITKRNGETRSWASKDFAVVRPSSIAKEWSNKACIFPVVVATDSWSSYAQAGTVSFWFSMLGLKTTVLDANSDADAPTRGGDEVIAGGEAIPGALSRVGGEANLNYSGSML